MKVSKIRKRTPKQGGGNGHKTNWLQLLKNSLAAILADTGELQADWADAGRLDAILDLCALEATLTDIKGVGWTDQNLTTIDGIADDIKTTLTDGGFIDGLLDTIIANIATAQGNITDILADTNELELDWKEGGRLDLLIDAITTHLTDIKGVGWANETLVAIKAAIDGIAGVNTYQEDIPDTDFSLAAIDKTLTDDPPGADEENSVVDIDAIADPATTFVLRSLIINVVGFGTDATKLTFGLWVPVNGTILQVDTVEVTVTGFQNLMDLFGLPEVHADSIHITVISDGDTADASIVGTYKYAKANS